MQQERAEEVVASLFLGPFKQAQQDGRLAPGIDVLRAARLAQSLAADGMRHWSAGVYGDRRLADVLAADITALLAGLRP